MGVAALVLGIISILVGFIPVCGLIALVPAIIGLILGIVDVIQKNKRGEKKGIAIAGIVCSAIAIIIISAWYFAVTATAKKAADALNSYDWNELATSLNSIDWNSYNWNSLAE